MLSENLVNPDNKIACHKRKTTVSTHISNTGDKRYVHGIDFDGTSSKLYAILDGLIRITSRYLI